MYLLWFNLAVALLWGVYLGIYMYVNSESRKKRVKDKRFCKRNNKSYKDYSEMINDMERW